MAMTLAQLREDASAHCGSCPHQTRLGNASVTCDGTLIPFSVGRCPLKLWDHSTPQPVVVRKAKVAREPETVDVCFHKFREWPVDVWIEIQKCPLVGSRFKVPREMYERIKVQWLGK